MANSQQLWHETKTNPPTRVETPRWFGAWLKLLSQPRHSSPSRDQRNKARERTLSTRQLERIKIMSGAFDDREISEKVALAGSSILDVGRGDVLISQAGKYVHPRLFRVI